MMRVFFGKPRRVLKGWDQPGSKAGADMGQQFAQMNGNFWVFTPFRVGPQDILAEPTHRPYISLLFFDKLI